MAPFREKGGFFIPSFAYICRMTRPDILGFLFITAVLFSCGGSRSFPVQAGHTIQYDIISGKKSVRLTANIISNTDDFKFDYEVEGEDIAGTISVSSKARLEATELYHLFDGQKKYLSETTSLRLSSKAYAELNEKGESLIAFRQGFVKNELTYKVVDRPEVVFSLNGKPKAFKTLYLEDTAGKGFKFWIWDNGDPLILRLDLGWQMVMKNLQTE